MDVVIGLGPAGTKLVKHLLASGRDVRAVDFEDPTKHPDKFGPVPDGTHLELMQGDATNAASMAKCLAGVEGAVLAFQGRNYFSAGKVDEAGVKIVAAAAKEAGVKRVVLISSLFVTDRHKRHPLRIMLNNIRFKMMDRKRDGEQHLRNSGVPYCIVRPGRFVDKPAGAAAKLRAGQGDTLNGSISPVDVAAICAAALRNPAADGVTFEVVDEWAKAPDEKAAPTDAAADDDAAVGGSGGSGPTQSIQQQVETLFQGLVRDAA